MLKPIDLSALLFIISVFYINSKEPSMITVPLKVLHKSFEKYPFPNKTSLILF